MLDDEHSLPGVLDLELVRPEIAVDARLGSLGSSEQDPQRGGTPRREEVPAFPPKELGADRVGAVFGASGISKGCDKIERDDEETKGPGPGSQTSRCSGVNVSPPPAYY